MTKIYIDFITIFLGFFAIMNPIANTAIFASITSNNSLKEQKEIAFKSILASFIIINIFAIFGKIIFHLFGITLFSLRITGGVLIFLVGSKMLTGNSSKLHTSENKDSSNVAFSPLATPILAGPGTIATAMNFSATHSVYGIVVTIGVFFLLCLITYFCFIFSYKILFVIGNNGLNIITRLMGFILAIIGMQMGIQGILEIIKAYPLT